MTRLLLALLCALGLAFSPMTAVASPLSGDAMKECTMGGGDMPNMPGDHSKMDCCTPACHAPSAAALLPKSDAGPSESFADKTPLAWAPSRELLSAVSSGLDPPPRA